MTIMRPIEGQRTGSAETAVVPLVPREDLDAVFRRASELNIQESAADAFSEQEVLEIGAELGLAPSEIRRALYERVRQREESRADRLCGDARPVVFAVMPGASEELLDRLLRVLADREGLLQVRADGARRVLTHNRDPVARAVRFVTGGRRPTLRAAGRVELAVRPLGDGTSHVALAADYTRSRRRTVRRSAAVGSIASLGLGLGTGIAAGAGMPIGAEAALATGMVSGFATFGGGMAATLLLAGRRVRSRTDGTRVAMQALLDRMGVEMRREPPMVAGLRRVEALLRGGSRSPAVPGGRSG